MSSTSMFLLSMALLWAQGAHGSLMSVDAVAPKAPTEVSCYSGCDATYMLQAKSRRLPSKAEPDLAATVVQINKESPYFPQPRASAKTALCFSGGGSRSLSLSMGYYRALVSLGILPKGVDAISSVSGGTWASSQYMFADRTSEQLLGKPTSPEELTMQVLDSTPPDMGATATTNTNALATQAVERQGAACALRNRNNKTKLKECVAKLAHDLWVNVIGEAMLGPYNLDRDKYMASSQEAVNAIVAENPSLKKKDFVVPVPDRPKTFVMNGALGAPIGYMTTSFNMVSLQMSPDFTGSPYHPNSSTVNYMPSQAVRASKKREPLQDVVVGGGLVSSFAFQSGSSQAVPSSVAPQSLAEVTAPTWKFTLAKAIGISSAAFASETDVFAPAQNVNPQGMYWPVTGQAEVGHEYSFVDGGNLEDLGVVAMLQNRATKLAVFFNTATVLNASLNLCDLPAGADLTGAAASDLSCLFGYCTGWSGPVYIYSNNQVFPRSDYPELLCKLQTEKDAGRSAVALTKLTTIENSWWGVPAGLEVEIIWAYNEQVKNFERSLPAETQAEIARGTDGPFAHYPFYKTTLQNPPQTTSLNANQVNLLAAQAEYSILEHKDLFCYLFLCQ